MLGLMPIFEIPSLKLVVVFVYSVNASLLISAKPVARWAMPVGNCTALSMAFNLMDKCHLTRPLEVEMTHSTLFSTKLELASMYQGPSLLTWNPP
jgi:hypothetical protein